MRDEPICLYPEYFLPVQKILSRFFVRQTNVLNVTWLTTCVFIFPFFSRFVTHLHLEQFSEVNREKYNQHPTQTLLLKITRFIGICVDTNILSNHIILLV